MEHRVPWLWCFVPLWLVLALGGCADTGYYWQSIRGHLQLMHAARPISAWLDDANTPATLKERLQLAQSIRQFASTELHLPDNASYQAYADLQRPYVVWNVVAAPALSLTLKTWCFPLAGCVGYRGYFDEAAAKRLAAELQAQGFEVSVYGVPAYSTLGWLNAVGGDPLPSTVINTPDAELARLIFHELAHQVVYVPDDTVFNESFATAVERLGVAAWLAQPHHDVARAPYHALEQRRAEFRALTRATRERLAAIYTQNSASAQTQQALYALKKEAMQAFRRDYEALKARWGGYSGYDRWVARANNAAFGAQAAYDEGVPGFLALFRKVGGDWPRFYDAVRQLAKQAPQARAKQLQLWAQEQAGG